MSSRLVLLRFAIALWALVPGVARAQVGSRIECPSREELQQLRPLAEGGAAGLVLNPDGGPAARITVAVPVRAPLAAVRQALLDAERWPEYMPALQSVTLLSRRGRRAAYRFEVSASLLNVTATTSLTEVGERRVDFTVLESDFGVAAARWDLLDDGPGRTLLVVTEWSDPSQGHWLLRQAARSSLTATAGMNVSIDLSLALSVARRAMSLAGTPTPARPSRASAPVEVLTPPAPGPWCSLVADPRRYYVYSIGLAEDGAVSQISVMHHTWGRADVLQQRLDDLAHYNERVPGIRRVTMLEGAGDETARAEISVSSPFDSGAGELVRRHDGPSVTLLEGTSGALTGTRWRWDITRDAQRGNFVSLTGTVGEGMASTLARAAAGREPYLYAGIAAMRELMWLRYMLAGLPFPGG